MLVITFMSTITATHAQEGNLLVFSGAKADRYDGATGAFIDEFIPNTINTVVDMIFIPSSTASACTLGQNNNYTSGTLSMDFTLGATVPTTWNVYLTVFDVVVPLFSVPLPAIDPPIAIPLAFPFPSFGEIEILTTLTTPGGGIICSDWANVDTGP